MSNDPKSMDSSPEGTPPKTAIRNPCLATVRAEHEKARRISDELRKKFNDLSRKVEPDVEPDEEQVEPDPRASLELASLGAEMALKEKEAIRLERDVVTEEQHAGLLHPEEAERRMRNLNQRFLSAGDELWRQQKKKIRFDDAGTARSLEPHGNALSECLLALYKKCDGLSKKGNRPSQWRKDALNYYAGSSGHHGKPETREAWCHISGEWHPSDDVKAAPIVSFFLDTADIGAMLFGGRAESLSRAGNALLLSRKIESWFVRNFLVVVPIDANETPITRWRTDVLSSDIRKKVFGHHRSGNDLDGNELKFLGEKRPVARFLYFRFIMTLVRIKDTKRRGWQEIWARYHEQRPFPTPGNYMRQSMLLALSTHFGTADMHVVESWIRDHGFDSPLKLTDDEATETARRVHMAVDDAISRAENRAEKQERLDEGLSEDSSEEEDSSGDSSEEGPEEEDEKRAEGED